MCSFPFRSIEKSIHQFWDQIKLYETKEDHSREKYYVLDMFPYPSGAGLHVGHPLGYIASDIYSRFKSMCGFNVLHPMGFDAFGLPAEQYAIQTGQAPQVTTEQNIQTYKTQLHKMGLSFDWSREFRTSDPSYYKWTQWFFLKLFKSTFDLKKQKAAPIEELIQHLEKQGLDIHSCPYQFDGITQNISQDQWKQMSKLEQAEILMKFRLAYRSESFVNWCPELGTVLANDEVSEGKSIRGGHPVYQKKMFQWFLRTSAYAERLLQSLEEIDWSPAIKEVQKNWIGKSKGSLVKFALETPSKDNDYIEIFTSRIDTIMGVSFMTLAPEHPLVEHLTTLEQKNEVESYVKKAMSKTEKERMENAKTVSGAFTGSYCKHPLTNEKIPVWISEYVLYGYGTGAVMAVPAHDERDQKFAEHFDLPIKEVIDSEKNILINSDQFNGLKVKEAQTLITQTLEKENLASFKTQYKLRDATFSRQRYWGEPIPIFYKDGIATALDESELPLTLPEMQSYGPAEGGEPPLARLKNWKTKDGYPLETSTMPGFAGSCAYHFRYMDPKNDEALVSPEKQAYWKNVDLYLGGSEHATGHLIYSRFVGQFLYDLGVTQHKEPFQKLINQGMILGTTAFIYRHKDTQTLTSFDLVENEDEFTKIRVDVNLVEGDKISLEKLIKWRPEFQNLPVHSQHKGLLTISKSTEKMSKSYFNVVNPDHIINEYGADTFRLYEMFLGPITMSKPWETEKITGVFKFLTKLHKSLFNENEELSLTQKDPTKEELKILHRTIKKIRQDYETFSFNTSVSTFMIALNDLTKLKSNNFKIFESIIQLMAPMTPFLSEYVWKKMGHETSIFHSQFPVHDESYLVESDYKYPVSFNGKMKFLHTLPIDLSKNDVEKQILELEEVKRILADKEVKKFIFVPQKIINIVY